MSTLWALSLDGTVHRNPKHECPTSWPTVLSTLQLSLPIENPEVFVSYSLLVNHPFGFSSSSSSFSSLLYSQITKECITSVNLSWCLSDHLIRIFLVLVTTSFLSFVLPLFVSFLPCLLLSFFPSFLLPSCLPSLNL